jgi:hypothetical protein
MTEQELGPAPWIGRELFDANAKRIGTIAGLAFPRRRFGTKWLSVETDDAKLIPVPLIGIRTSGDRLVLPYPLSYIKGGPAIVDDQPLSQAEQRRLGLHYGFDNRLAGVGCCQTCGLCHARTRPRPPRPPVSLTASD